MLGSDTAVIKASANFMGSPGAGRLCSVSWDEGWAFVLLHGLVIGCQVSLVREKQLGQSSFPGWD